MDKLTACRLLNLEPDATKAEAKTAFRALAKSWHPDRFAGKSCDTAQAEQRMKEINEAFSFLFPLLPEARKRETPHRETCPETKNSKENGFWAALGKRFGTRKNYTKPGVRPAVSPSGSTPRKGTGGVSRKLRFDAVLRQVETGAPQDRPPGNRYAAYSRYVRLKRQIRQQQARSQAAGRVEKISPVMPVRSVDGG